MGCDIHTFVEVKVNGSWHLFDQPYVRRNYDLFSRMAGVRGEEMPIVKPKGLPDDISNITSMMAAHAGEDGHTHSWFNQAEIDMLKEYYEDPFGFYDDFGFTTSNGDYDFIEDTRLVFWFDN